MGYDSLIAQWRREDRGPGHARSPLGFGTWLVTGEDAAEGVRDGLEIGRRQIESALVVCDQVESHAFLDQHPLLERARESEVLVSAYSALAHGRVPDDQTLRWIGESRRENFEVFDFDLGQPERDEIDLLPTDVRTANPPWAPDWNA